MTNTTRILNDTDLETVTGGGSGPVTLSSATSTIVVPHIPRDKDLLTPQMIAKLISPGFNPPIPLNY